jgi:lysophospholipase L1-like esterase
LRSILVKTTWVLRSFSNLKEDQHLMKLSLLRTLVVVLASVLIPTGRSRADMVYVALGDSVTFGIDPSTAASLAPSFGDQGFVRPLANALAGMNGGVRPNVLNLGVSGELSTTFFSATSPPGWTNRAPELNLNYPGATTAQNDLMVSSINSIHAAGNTVGVVTFVIGSNDIFYLVGTPAFQAASPAEQQAMIGATLGVVQGNYVTTLSELAVLAPEAKVILPIYYNPYPTFAPEHAFYDQILSAFQSIVRGDAAAFGATPVDLAPPFLGNELALTNIASGDVHPNQAGYAVIASTLAQAVPEPCSIVLLGMAGTAIGCRTAWRRRTPTRAKAG